MAIDSNMKIRNNNFATSAPTDDNWIQPPVTQQDLFTANQKLIDNIYIEITETINSKLRFDSEFIEIESAALFDFWNIEQSED